MFVISNLVRLQILIFILWCYGGKFIPAVIGILLTYCSALATECPNSILTNTTEENYNTNDDVNFDCCDDEIIAFSQQLSLLCVVLSLGKYDSITNYKL